MYTPKIHLPLSRIQLGVNSLNWLNKFRYLGIFIANNSKNLFDLNKQGKFYAAIHSIISNCGLSEELFVLEILKRKCTCIYPFYALDAISVKRHNNAI